MSALLLPTDVNPQTSGETMSQDVDEMSRSALRQLLRSGLETDRRQRYRTRPGTILSEGRYTVARQLGRGLTSDVWLARDVTESKWVAIKAMTTTSTKKHIADEIRLLRQLVEHRSSEHFPYTAHLPLLYDSFVRPGPLGDHAMIVMEPLAMSPTTLDRSLVVKDRSPAFAKNVVKQILGALRHLHEQCDVVYTDLKLDNIAIRPKDFDKIIELCAARAIPSNHVSAGETGSPPGPCQLSGSGSTKGDPLPPWPSSVFDWVTSVRKIWDRPQGFRKVQWDDPADLEQLGKIDVVLIDVGHCSLAAPDQRHLIQPEGFRAPEVELGSHGVFQSMSDPSAALSLYEMMTKKPLFGTAADLSLYEATIITGQTFATCMKDDAVRWAKVSDEHDVLRSNDTWKPDPEHLYFISHRFGENRPDLGERARHTLVAFILRCLVLDPQARSTAAELLEDYWLLEMTE